MPEKFCFSCGSKIAAESVFCPVCGAKQNAVMATPEMQPINAPVRTQQAKNNSMKIVLIIIGIVIAVALIALCIILVMDSDDSRDSGGSGISLGNDSDGESNKGTNITPYAKVNGESLSDVTAAFSSEDGYVVLCVSGVFKDDSNLGGMGTVVIDEDMCKSGFTMTDSDSSDSSYFDIIMIDGTDMMEITSVKDPSYFKDCSFELLSYEPGSKATFKMSIEFVSHGDNFCLECGATADYTQYSQGNLGNTYNSTNNGGYIEGNTGNRMCGACYGSGECSVCDGSGETSYYILGEKGTCTSCNGSTRCKACGGAGYY